MIAGPTKAHAWPMRFDGWRAPAMDEVQILAEWDYLTLEDITACLRYAAHLANERTVSTAP